MIGVDLDENCRDEHEEEQEDLVALNAFPKSGIGGSGVGRSFHG